MKKTAKKAIVTMLASAVLFQAIPFTQLGLMVSEAHAESEMLRSELAARAEEYPEGAFAFYTSASDAAEGSDDIAVKVVRIGDTSAAASVDVKAADVTAKYGDDYSLYFKDGLTQIPFVQNNTAVQNDEAQQEAVEAADTDNDKAADEEYTSGGLRAAYTQQTGKETVNTNWRGEYTEQAAKAASVQAENELINAFDGAELTLDFEAGEFEKDIFIHFEDDDKAESEESFALLLGNATVGRLDAQMQHNVTIHDNEEAQDVVFAMKESEITLGENDTSAKITVVRTSGIDYYAGAVLQTVAGTAEPLVDYEPANNAEVAFKPGETERTVEIPIIGDRDESKQFTVRLTGVKTEEGKDSTDVYFGSKILAYMAQNEIEKIDLLQQIQPTTAAFEDEPSAASYVVTENGVKYDVYPIDISSNPLVAYTHDSVKLDQTAASAKVYYNIGYAAKLKLYTKLSGNSRNWFFGYHYYYGKTGTLYLDGVKMLENKTADKKSEETKYFTTMKDVTYRQSTVNSVFQVKANTDGLCRTAQFEMTRYDSYVPRYTLSIINENPKFVSYNYTSPTAKTASNVNALSKVIWAANTTKELSLPGGSVDITPGVTNPGITITGYEVYAGSSKIATFNGSSVLTYSQVSALRDSYESKIKSANYRLNIKPIYTVEKTKVSFDSQGQTEIGIDNFKYGSKNALNINRIDTVTVTARSVGDQGFFPASIMLFNITNGKEAAKEEAENVSKSDPFTHTFKLSAPEVLIRAYLSTPTLTVYNEADYYDEETKEKIKSKDAGQVLLSTFADPGNTIGVSEYGKQISFPDEHPYGLAGMNESYLLTSFIDESRRYGSVEGNPARLLTQWTYLDPKYGESRTVFGDMFAFKPYYADTLIKYVFTYMQEDVYPQKVKGKVMLQEVPLFSSCTSPQTFPAVGVQMNIGGCRTVTDKDGCYSTDTGFMRGINISAFMQLDTLTRSDTIAISDNTTKDMTIVVNDSDPIKVVSSVMTMDKPTGERTMSNEPIYVETPTEAMTLEDAEYHLRMTVTGQAGVVPGRAEVRVYDKYGNLRSNVRPSGTFDSNYSVDIEIDPLRDGLEVGDTLAVKIYDTNGNGYFERHTRIIVAEQLKSMYMFNYPGTKQEGDNDFLKALGNLSIGYDFVIDAAANSYGTYAEKDTGIVHNMMYVGFGSGFSTPEKAYSLEQTILQGYDTIFDDIQDGSVTPTMKDDVSMFGNDNGAFSLNITIGAIMDCVLQQGENQGKYAFGDFIIIGKADVSVNREWAVPVGPITLTFSISVKSADPDSQVMTGIKWHLYNASDTPYIMSDNSTIDLLAADGISNEGDITLYMSATGGVDASVLSGLAGAGGNINVTVEHHSLYGKDEGWSNYGKFSLTPSVYIKILFAKINVWKDTWVQSYNDAAGINAISARIQEAASDDVLFTPTEMRYLSEFENAQNAAFHSSPDVTVSDDVNVLTQGVLKDAVAENSDICMQDIGDGKYLAVFIDAVPGRSAENSLGAYYTVFDGKVWSAPQLLEDDGTTDQLPTICEAGSKGYLIAWSDASRTYEKDEPLTASLNALDLTGRFYDAKTDTLGEVMELTHETAEDNVSDSAPQIVYDNENGVEHMRLYYTKSEFAISDSEQGEVVGDILNPYQVIAVRTYDFANDKWRDDYFGTAKNEIIDRMGESGYTEYVDNWYGQEFLDLAPSVEITEELDENGFWKENTTASFTDTDMSQTVIKGGDSIAYNHLSLFAYALDKGGMSQQTGDMNLYLQIYNINDDEYHHPIQITSKNAEISDIQFNRIKLYDGSEATFLYWLEDGIVKCINISDLVAKNLIKGTTSGGQEFYYIDKSDLGEDSYAPEYVAASAYTDSDDDENSDSEQPLSIASYKIRQNNGCNYIVWTQFTARGEGDSAKSELQLFAAVEDFRNGVISMPVQLTAEEDLYISGFDCMVTDDGSLDVMAICQKLDENGSPDPASAQLRTMHIVPADKPEIVSAQQADIVTDEDGRAAAEFSVTVANRGLSAKDNVVIEIRNADGEVVSTTAAPLVSYEAVETPQEDGSVTLAEVRTETEVEPITLVGGEKYVTKLSLPLESDGSFSGTVNIVSNGEVIASKPISGKAEPELTVSGLAVSIDKRDHVTLTASISNNSVLDSGAQTIVYGYIDENGERVPLGSKDISALAVGSQTEITVQAEVDFDKFTSVINEDGSITDSMQFYMDTASGDGVADYTTLELNATAEEAAFMTSLSNLSACPGVYGDDGKVHLTDGFKVGEKVDMQLLIGDKIAANTLDYVNRTKIVWTDVDGNAVELDENGIPQAVAEGTVTLRGYVVPYDMTSMVYADGIAEDIDNYNVKPSAVLIPIEAVVTISADNIGDNDDDSSDNSGGGSGGSQDNSSSKTNGSTNSPKTGDTSAAAAIVLLAAAALGAVAISRKRNNENRENNENTEE